MVIIFKSNIKEEEEEGKHRLIACYFMCDAVQFIRAGQIDEAVEHCRRRAQPWRAASLLGGNLSHFRIGDGNSITNDPTLFYGNPNRGLWKSTCWELSLRDNVSLCERKIGH